jgi:hypothetical protein
MVFFPKLFDWAACVTTLPSRKRRAYDDGPYYGMAGACIQLAGRRGALKEFIGHQRAVISS